MEIRQITRDDLPQVLVIQKDSYTLPLIESEDSFARKLALFPDCCLGGFEKQQLIAYIFTHPWVFGKIVSLNDCMTIAPHTANCIYIHDLAVLRSWRGRGIAHALLKRILRIARSRELNKIALVAVNETEPFWERYGLQRQYQLIYGDGIPATYMMGNARNDSVPGEPRRGNFLETLINAVVKEDDDFLYD
jgi:GNAT superfamily N-acetyltransferase